MVPLPPSQQRSVDVLTLLHQFESSEVAASVAFPIVTEGSEGQVKVRRGEDWRRSHHNATHDSNERKGRWLHKRGQATPTSGITTTKAHTDSSFSLP